jgi:hypothetical protein
VFGAESLVPTTTAYRNHWVLVDLIFFTTVYVLLVDVAVGTLVASEPQFFSLVAAVSIVVLLSFYALCKKQTKTRFAWMVYFRVSKWV